LSRIPAGCHDFGATTTTELAPSNADQPGRFATQYSEYGRRFSDERTRPMKVYCAFSTVVRFAFWVLVIGILVGLLAGVHSVPAYRRQPGPAITTIDKEINEPVGPDSRADRPLIVRGAP
jgi:hypothetical protein